MDPNTISALTHLLSILNRMSGWPFGSMLVLCLLGPWITSICLAWWHQRQIEEIRAMYENNAELVKQAVDVSSDLKEVVMLNTEAMTRASQDIRTNQFCPGHRTEMVKTVQARSDHGS